MSWENIHVDDFGQVVKLRIVQDKTAVDISSYTTRVFVLRDPDGTAATETATFSSDGTDGYLQYTIADGDIDAAGPWSASARISQVDVELTSAPVSFHVSPRPD